MHIVDPLFKATPVQEKAANFLAAKPSATVNAVFRKHCGYTAVSYGNVFSVIRNGLEESHNFHSGSKRNGDNIPELHLLETITNSIMKLDTGVYARECARKRKDLGPFTEKDAELLKRFPEALQSAIAFYEKEAQNARQLTRCKKILAQNPYAKIVKRDTGYTIRNGELTYIFSHPVEIAFLDRASDDAVLVGARILEQAEQNFEEMAARAKVMLALLPILGSEVNRIFPSPTSLPQISAPDAVIKATNNLGRLVPGQALSNLPEGFPLPSHIREYIEQKSHYNLGGGSPLAQFIMLIVHSVSSLYTRGLVSAAGKAFCVEDMKQLEQLLESVRHLEDGYLSGTDVKRFALSPQHFISIAERLGKTQDPEVSRFAEMIRDVVPHLEALATELASTRSIPQLAPGT